MNALSQVSCLFGAHSGEIEKARDIFTAETKALVSGILSALAHEPWTSPLVRIEVARSIETEGKKTGYISEQHATGCGDLKFKKLGTNYLKIAAVTFGFGFDQDADAFCWLVTLTPMQQYPSLDDRLFKEWEARKPAPAMSSRHLARDGSIRFAQRGLQGAFTAHEASEDVRTVFRFLLESDSAIKEGIGVDLAPGAEEE